MTAAVEEKIAHCLCGLSYSSTETLELHFRLTGHSPESGVTPQTRMRVRCDECGLETTRGGAIATHQKTSGHTGITELGLARVQPSTHRRRKHRGKKVALERQRERDAFKKDHGNLTESELRALDPQEPDALYFRDSPATADAVAMAGTLKDADYPTPCTWPEKMDLFFSDKPQDIRAAEETCLICPLMASCPYAGVTIEPLGPDQPWHRRT